MTHRKRLLPALMFVASTLVSVSVHAQVLLYSDVIGSGGTQATDGSLVLVGTAGQPIIGPIGSTDLNLSQGFWYTLPVRIPAAVPEDHSGGAASAVALHQNVPNPFSTTTDIQIDLPARSRVSLKIFDAIGRDVMTLVDGDREAGSLTVHVSADGLESGRYVARLIANGVTRTIGMIVVH